MREYRYDDEYYNQERTDNRTRLGAVLSLLLIPLVAFGLYFAWNSMHNRQNNTAYNQIVSPVPTNNSATETRGVQTGIGGAPGTSITPSKTATGSVTISPTSTVTPSVTMTPSRNGLSQGVGGSSGTVPNGAPQTGLGGMYR